MTRFGIGYDVHRLVADRPLILGGVHIPWEKGLLGHSDADVATHALCDALLGAAALGDIGHHFPASDERWRGVNSQLLLSRVTELLRENGYRPHNVDLVIIAERPKLAPHILSMRETLARSLGCPIEQVGVKATTTEGLGFTGRGEGIAAQAVASIAPLPAVAVESSGQPGR